MHRLLLTVLILVSAVAVAAWGWFGGEDAPAPAVGVLDAATGPAGGTPSNSSTVTVTFTVAASPPVATTPLQTPTAIYTVPAATDVAPTTTATATPRRTTPTPRATVRSGGGRPPTATPFGPTGTPTPVAVAGCYVGAAMPPASANDPLVTTSPVNLRAGPGTTCGVLRVLPSRTEVERRSGAVRADGRPWVLVAVAGEGVTGWVAADFLRDAREG